MALEYWYRFGDILGGKGESGLAGGGQNQPKSSNNIQKSKKIATLKTQDMKIDETWFNDLNMGNFKSYWGTKQHTKHTYYYHEVKTYIDRKVRLTSTNNNDVPRGGSFDVQFELTPHMKSVIKSYRSYCSIKDNQKKIDINEQVISQFDNNVVTYGDVFNHLFEEKWLNDNIVDTFGKLLQKESKRNIILNSYTLTRDNANMLSEKSLFTIQDWICRAINTVTGMNYAREDLNVALENVDTLLIPTCDGIHWYLCVVNLDQNVATVLDGYNTDYQRFTKQLLVNILFTLQHYHKNTKPIKNFNLATMNIIRSIISEQKDSNNCGVIVLKTMYSLINPPCKKYSSHPEECTKFREYIFFRLIQSSTIQNNLPITITDADVDHKSWDNINIFKFPTTNKDKSNFTSTSDNVTSVNNLITSKIENFQEENNNDIALEQEHHCTQKNNNSPDKNLNTNKEILEEEHKNASNTKHNYEERSNVESTQDDILEEENKNKITSNTQPNYERTSNFEPTQDDILEQENKNKITTNTQPNYEGTSNFEPTRDEKTSSNIASDNIQYETTERNIDKHTFNSEIDESHLAPNINKEIVQIEDCSKKNNIQDMIIHQESKSDAKGNCNIEQQPSLEDKDNQKIARSESKIFISNQNDPVQVIDNTNTTNKKNIEQHDSNYTTKLNPATSISGNNSKTRTHQDPEIPTMNNNVNANDEENQHSHSGNSNDSTDIQSMTTDELTVSSNGVPKKNDSMYTDGSNIYTDDEIGKKIKYLNEDYTSLTFMRYFMVTRIKVKEMRKIREENGDNCSDLGDDVYVNTFYRYHKDAEGNKVKTEYKTVKDAEMYLYFVGLTDTVERTNENHGTEYFQLEDEFVKNWLGSKNLSKQQQKFLKNSKNHLNAWRKITPDLLSKYKLELKSDRENILKDIKFPIKEVIVHKKIDNNNRYICNVSLHQNIVHSFPLIKEDIEILDIKKEMKDFMAHKENRSKSVIKLRLTCNLMTSKNTYISGVHAVMPVNAPKIRFYQGTKKKCTPYSFCSVLYYWAKINALRYDPEIISTIKTQIEMIKKSLEPGPDVRTKCIQMMQRTGWTVKAYPIPKKKKKLQKLHYGDITNNFDPLTDKEPPGSFLWGVLNVGRGLTTHMVSIYDDWIFDPNYLRAFTRERKSLDVCSDVTQTGYKYCGFLKIYIFTPTFSKIDQVT